MAFRFQVGERVKQKSSGETGTVERCDVFNDVRFYQVNFDDEKIASVAEEDLEPRSELPEAAPRG